MKRSLADNQKKVLIVDDDAELSEGLREVLSDMGFLVTIVASGIAGARILKNEIFDILLLDMKMPGMNSDSIIRELSVKNPKTKIFVMSGTPHLPQVLKSRDLHSFVAGALSKPFPVEELVEKITYATGSTDSH